MTTVPSPVYARSKAAAERLREAGLDAGERLRAAGLSWPLAWMGLLALVLLWTRLVGLDQSFQNDEAFTVLYYVIPGPDGFLFGDYNPNNHVLFSWLAWATTSVLGQSESLDRIWAVFPGLAAVGLLGLWVWRRLGPWTAVIAVFLVTIAPLILDLGKQARGYGLVSMAFVLLLIASDRVLSDPSRRSFAAWGVAGFVGVATHMIFTLAFLGSAVGLALVVARRRTLAVVVGAVAVAAVVFYAPLLDGMWEDFGSFSTASSDPSYSASIGSSLEFAASPRRADLPWHGPISGPAALGARGVELLFTGEARYCNARCFEGADFVRYVLPALVLMVLGGAVLWRARDRRLLTVIAMPVLLTCTALTLSDSLVVDRFLSHLFFAVAVLMAAAIAAVGSALWKMRPLRGVVVVLGAVLALSGLMRVIDLHSQWVAVPFEDFKRVGAVVNNSGVEPVVTNSTALAGLHFYVGEGRLEVLPTAGLGELFCDRRAGFVYVENPYRAVRPTTRCLADRGAAVVRVNQRGRVGFLDVWIVPPPP